MPFENPLRRRWAAGEPTMSAWLTTGEPLIGQYLGAAGYDEVCADLQHGLIEYSHLPNLFQAIESSGAAPACRVPVNDPTLIGRACDLGALAIVVPMVESAEEALRAARACRYPPSGNRSMGPIRSMVTMKSFDPIDLGQVVCMVQVETAKGLANVDAIASTPGVDAIFIGPSDLALSLGLPDSAADRTPEQAERHAQAIRDIVAACQRAGIIAAIITGDGTGAAKRLEEGFRHIAATSDIALIANGGAAELAAARRGRLTPVAAPRP